MNHPRVIRAHYFARSLILLGFALFIAHLSKAGALKYYIAPTMEPYIRYCPIALVLMAVSLAYQALFQKAAVLCDCERPLSASSWKNAAVYGLFLLPLLLGALLPDQALGSSAAAKRGMSLTSPSLPQSNWRRRLKRPTRITPNSPNWPSGCTRRRSSRSGRRFSRKRWGRSSCSRINFAEKSQTERVCVPSAERP